MTSGGCEVNAGEGGEVKLLSSCFSTYSVNVCHLPYSVCVFFCCFFLLLTYLGKHKTCTECMYVHIPSDGAATEAWPPW